MSKKIARYLFCVCKYMVKLQRSSPKLILVRQNRINVASFLKRYFIFTLDFIFLMFSHRQTFYMALPVLSHSYIMSKNLAFPERIYICLVDLRGNKSETCHTNETRMRHFLVPNGNDHARRVIESILNQYLFFLHQLLILKEPSWQNHKIRENVSIQHNFGWSNSAGFALGLQFELFFL